MEKMSKTLNVDEELEKINLSTVYEFEKSTDNFEIDKINLYKAKDNEKTICLIFYYNQFIAINRVNYENGFKYDEKQFGITENLNYRIRKIPNVAKTRKILEIDDIETRIYDISEYVILLNKETIKILKVNPEADLKEIEYSKEDLNIENYNQYKIKQEEQEKILEDSQKKTSIIEWFKHAILEPIKNIKNKILKTKDVKLLSDGTNSIFDKNEKIG